MTADGEHQLTPEQREAIDSRDRDVFLRAGAGTGKTTVLVDRFCAAALDPDVGVDRILAFTFTERAADQLRRRVRERFAQLGREAEGERRERIEEAERAADRAWISTIHGFCRRVLASHPAAAGIDPRFRVADQVESDRLAGRAFDAALEDLVQAGGAEALELAAANRRRTLLEMTRGAYDELRSQGHPAPELPEPPPVDHAASLSALIETAGLAHEECAEARPQQVSQRELIAAASALDREAPADAELLDRLASLKITTTAKEFKGEACERYREALLAARSAVAATVLGPAYEQLRELVRRFGECYEALKADRSALDFEDLQLRARELLSSNEALRDRYREQFRHLMVDEFQDTNGLQLGLIEQLRGPQTRLFMVGDEFQSIYGFRHADVEVYRRQQRRFAQGEEPNGVALPLTGNFRSSGEVLAMTNALGRSLLAGFEPLTVAGEEAGAEGPAVELLLTAEDKKGWEAEETELRLLPDDPSSASKVAEARRLAGRLRELVDEGEDPSQIVVLLRAFTHVTTLERALGDAGLDPYVVGGRGFWSQQQVEDMRCLLAVIANPLDDQALFGALASPACAVLPDTLWLLRGAATEEREDGRRSNRHVWPLLRDLAEHGEAQRGDTDAAAMIPPGELQRLREFAEQIGTLRQRGAEDGLESLVERTAVALQYDIATLVRDSGEARWANVRKLMRLAREFETREGPDLAAFLEYLVSRAASSDREAEAATRAEGHAGVRVMTVHSAKGLEFGVVAVADLGRRPQLGWTPLRLGRTEETPDDGEAARVGVQLGRLGRPGERLHGYAELTELAADREAEEEGRLAYVAATRAERRLLLSGTVNPNAKRSDKPNRQPIATQLLAKVLEGDPSSREMQLEAAGEGFPAGRLAVSLSSPGPGVGARLLRQTETPAAEAPSEDREPPLKRPRAVAAPAGALSYSALSDYESCGYRYYVKRVLGLTGAEGGVAVGAVGARDDEDRASPAETPPLWAWTGRALPARVERPAPLGRARRRAHGHRAARAGPAGWRTGGRTRPGAGSRLARLGPARGAGPGEHQPRASLRPHPRETTRSAAPSICSPNAATAPCWSWITRPTGSRAASLRRQPGATGSSASSTRLRHPAGGRLSRPPTSSSSARSRRSATPSSRPTSTPLANGSRGCSAASAKASSRSPTTPTRRSATTAQPASACARTRSAPRCATTPIRRSSRSRAASGRGPSPLRGRRPKAAPSPRRPCSTDGGPGRHSQVGCLRLRVAGVAGERRDDARAGSRRRTRRAARVEAALLDRPRQPHL